MHRRYKNELPWKHLHQHCPPSRPGANTRSALACHRERDEQYTHTQAKKRKSHVEHAHTKCGSFEKCSGRTLWSASSCCICSVQGRSGWSSFANCDSLAVFTAMMAAVMSTSYLALNTEWSTLIRRLNAREKSSAG